MKYYLTLLLIITSLVNSAYAQQRDPIPKKQLSPKKLTVLYDFEFKPDTLDLQDIVSEPMLLQVGDNMSKFISFWREFGDSLINASDLQTRNEIMRYPGKLAPMPRVHFFILKDFNNRTITHHEMILPDFFRYQEDMELFEWTILNETMQWNTFKLQKATTEFGGRKWIAWFAPDIPISDGPYKFNGLPGLIVNIKDENEHYSFRVKSISKAPENSYVETYKTMRYIDTDRNGFIRAYKNFRQDILNRANNAEIKNPEALQRIARNIERNNNPLELDFY